MTAKRSLLETCIWGWEQSSEIIAVGQYWKAMLMYMQKLKQEAVLSSRKKQKLIVEIINQHQQTQLLLQAIYSIPIYDIKRSEMKYNKTQHLLNPWSRLVFKTQVKSKQSRLEPIRDKRLRLKAPQRTMVPPDASERQNNHPGKSRVHHRAQQPPPQSWGIGCLCPGPALTQYSLSTSIKVQVKSCGRSLI